LERNTNLEEQSCQGSIPDEDIIGKYRNELCYIIILTVSTFNECFVLLPLPRLLQHNVDDDKDNSINLY